MSRAWLIGIAAFLAISSAIGLGVWYYTRPEPAKVVLKSVDRGHVEATVANTRAGTVKACRRAKLSPPIGGQVAELGVVRGQTVEAGQFLLRLWNDDLTAQLKLAESEAQTAEARALEACLTAQVAEREAKRLLKLKDKGLVSEERVDRAVTEAKAKEAGCEAAKAQAQVAKARVLLARANLARTYLVAPFAGIVAELNTEIGEFVTPSPPGIPTPPAIDLIDTSCIYVSAPIDEVDVPAIRLGMPARIALDAFPGKKFKGIVRRIAPYVLDIEKQARTVEVEVDFDPSEDIAHLLPGYSADIEVILKAKDGVLRVPTEAVLEGYRVFVYNPRTQRLEERPFTPGISNWAYTEVVSGLSEGEQVVVSVAREGVKAGARAVPE